MMSGIKYLVLSFLNLINLFFLQLLRMLVPKIKKSSGIAIIRLEQTLGDAVLGAAITKAYISNINQTVDVYVSRNNAWLYEAIPGVRVITLNKVRPRAWLSESLFFALLCFYNPTVFKHNYKILLSPRYWDDRLGALLSFALKADQKYGFAVDVTVARKRAHLFLGTVYNQTTGITPGIVHTLEIEGLVYSKAFCVKPISKTELDGFDCIFSVGIEMAVAPRSLAVSLSSGNSLLKKATIASFYNSIALICERFNIDIVRFYNPNDSGEEEKVLVELLSKLSIKYEYFLGIMSPDALISSLSANQFFIGCDSGLTHLAAQCGVQTFSLFTSSNYRLFAPVGNVHVVYVSVDCNPVNSKYLSDRCEKCIHGHQVCADISQGEFLKSVKWRK